MTRQDIHILITEFMHQLLVNSMTGKWLHLVIHKQVNKYLMKLISSYYVEFYLRYSLLLLMAILELGVLIIPNNMVIML